MEIFRDKKKDISYESTYIFSLGMIRLGYVGPVELGHRKVKDFRIGLTLRIKKHYPTFI